MTSSAVGSATRKSMSEGMPLPVTAAKGTGARRFCEATPFLPALRHISFGSCYVYSPRGDGYASMESRLVCLRLKAGDAAWLPVYAGRVRAHEVLASVFARDAVLIPVPGSRPSAKASRCAAQTSPAEGLLPGTGIRTASLANTLANTACVRTRPA